MSKQRPETQDVWEAFAEGLLNHIHKRVGDRSVALDIRQNVFLKIHENLPSLREVDALPAWVYRITRNAITDHFRRQSASEELPVNISEVEAEQDVLGCVLLLINELPGHYREVLMAALAGKSQITIAKQLDITVPAVKNRLLRARTALRDQLQACCGYQVGEGGHLVGEAICSRCGA